MTEQLLQDTCLFFPSGIPLLDRHDVDALEAGCNEDQGIFWVDQMADNGFNMRFRTLLDEERGINQAPYQRALSLREVAQNAEAVGVSWVAPTVHCSRVRTLALLAERIGLNYPSYPLVEAIEHKPTLYAALKRAGLPVPAWVECETAEDIERGVQELGALSVVKAAGDHSSMGLKTIDGREPLSARSKDDIAEHVMIRNSRGHETSVVTEFVGDEELGLMTMLEVSDIGVSFKWSMTTRKLIVPPFGTLLAHIYDPADKGRIELTNDLLLPTAQKGLESLLEGKPDIMRSRIGRYVLNGDFRTDSSKVWFIDGSLRWMPNSQQAANATIGQSCVSTVFPRFAVGWAKGQPINGELLKPKDERAVIMGKAYIEGGKIVAVPIPSTANSDGVFFTQTPIKGSVLPSSHQAGHAPAISEYPLVCVDGRDINEASRRWQNALADLGLGVERDGVVYDASSQVLSYRRT